MTSKNSSSEYTLIYNKHWKGEREKNDKKKRAKKKNFTKFFDQSNLIGHELLLFSQLLKRKNKKAFTLVNKLARLQMMKNQSICACAHTIRTT